MEQIGVRNEGQTSSKEIFANTSPPEWISAVFPGAQAATYAKGLAIVDDPSNDGMRQGYKNAVAVSDEAIGSGDGTTLAYDLANDDVIEDTLRVFDANGKQLPATLSKGTGAGGVDQAVLSTPQASGALKADYKHYPNGIASPAILGEEVTTTATGGQVTADAVEKGAIKTAEIVDADGNAIDEHFKSAMSRIAWK